MTKLLLATRNSNKKKEIKKLLSSFKDIEVMDMDDPGIRFPIIVENGKTFRQNAIKKAVITSKFFDGLVLSDDSGLKVKALQGKPGVRSARFARKNATDKENNRKLMKLMQKKPGLDRSAEFVCTLALAKGGKLLETIEGKVKGSISEKAKGKNGFGYDPLFIPEGHQKTFAQMSAKYKNGISHRALALKELKGVLKKYLEAS